MSVQRRCVGIDPRASYSRRLLAHCQRSAGADFPRCSLSYTPWCSWRQISIGLKKPGIWPAGPSFEHRSDHDCGCPVLASFARAGTTTAESKESEETNRRRVAHPLNRRSYHNRGCPVLAFFARAGFTTAECKESEETSRRRLAHPSAPVSSLRHSHRGCPILSRFVRKGGQHEPQFFKRRDTGPCLAKNPMMRHPQWLADSAKTYGLATRAGRACPEQLSAARVPKAWGRPRELKWPRLRMGHPPKLPIPMGVLWPPSRCAVPNVALRSRRMILGPRALRANSATASSRCHAGTG